MSAPIEVSETADPDEPAAVEAGVAAYGRSKAAGGNVRSAVAIAREFGRLAGGAVGRTEYGRLFVTSLWVAPEAWRRGLGTRVLESLEAEAARRGCTDALLDTLLAENVAFYVARGYRVVAVVANYVGPFRPHDPAQAARSCAGKRCGLTAASCRPAAAGRAWAGPRRKRKRRCTRCPVSLAPERTLLEPRVDVRGKPCRDARLTAP